MKVVISGLGEEKEGNPKKGNIGSMEGDATIFE